LGGVHISSDFAGTSRVRQPEKEIRGKNNNVRRREDPWELFALSIGNFKVNLRLLKEKNALPY
jgi:hypothetical protein